MLRKALFQEVLLLLDQKNLEFKAFTSTFVYLNFNYALVVFLYVAFLVKHLRKSYDYFRFPQLWFDS